MRAAITISILLAGCSNLGPFRAGDTGDDDGPDAGTMTVDADTVDDNTPPDGAVSGTVATKIADVAGEPLQLAATAGYIYWTTGEQTLERVAKSGSASPQAFDTGDYIRTITVRDNELYWTLDDAIHKTTDASFALGDPLHTDAALHDVMAVSADHVYFVEKGVGLGTDELIRIPRGGGSPQVVRSGLYTPSSLSIDGSDLYITTGADVQRAPLSAPTSTTTVDTGSIRNLVSRAGHTCWVKQPDPNQYTLELWCTHAGGKVRVATSPQQFMAVAISGSHVFFSSQLASGATEVRRYTFGDPSSSTRILDPVSGIVFTALAVDASSLYFAATNGATGAIYRRPL